MVEPLRWLDDSLNASLPRLQSWRWASIVVPRQRTEDNEEPGAGGAPLIWFSCALECAGLQVLSMDPLIPPWVPGTMGEEAWGHMWEETQIRAQLDL